jgi:DNA polymerase
MTQPINPSPTDPPGKKKPKKSDEEPTPLYDFSGTKMERLKEMWSTKWVGCKRCGLCEGRAGDDIVFADGNPDAKIMIVGEAPGVDEALECIPFVGSGGRMLDQILATVSDDVGIQELFKWVNTPRRSGEDKKHFHEAVQAWRSKEFFLTNVVACQPPDNRPPTKVEREACWERLYNIIYIVDPWLIIACGKSAIETLVGKKVEVTKMRGHLYEADIPGHIGTYRVPVIATLHPSHLLRLADWKEKDGMYMQTIRDFMDAMTYVDKLKNLELNPPVPIPHRITIPK